MAAPANEPWLEVTASRQFPAWLAEQNVSLALTTYQTGKLIMIGRHDGRIAVFERHLQPLHGAVGRRPNPMDERIPGANLENLHKSNLTNGLLRLSSYKAFLRPHLFCRIPRSRVRPKTSSAG